MKKISVIQILTVTSEHDEHIDLSNNIYLKRLITSPHMDCLIDLHNSIRFGSFNYG